MKTIQVFLCFLLNFMWIFFAVGLECPACIYISKGNDSPDEQSILDAIQLPETFRDEECEKHVDERKSAIQIERCIDSFGIVTRCGNYSGLVNAATTAPVAFELPVKLYHRGCYYFEKSRVPQYGCQTRSNVAEDIHLVNKTLSELASNLPLLNGIRVNKVEGELCLYTGAASEITPKSVTTNALSTISVTKNTETPKSTVNTVSGVSKGAPLSSFSVLRMTLFAVSGCLTSRMLH